MYLKWVVNKKCQVVIYKIIISIKKLNAIGNSNTKNNKAIKTSEILTYYLHLSIELKLEEFHCL